MAMSRWETLLLESDDVCPTAYEVDRQHHCRPQQGQSDGPACPPWLSEGL